jgi:hypothetical protein
VLEDAPDLVASWTLGERFVLRLEQSLRAASAAERASAKAIAGLLPRVTRDGDGPVPRDERFRNRTESVRPDAWVHSGFILGALGSEYEHGRLQQKNPLIAMQQKKYFDLAAPITEIEVDTNGETILTVGQEGRVYEIISRSEGAFTVAGTGVGSPVWAVTEVYGDPSRLLNASCGGVAQGFWLVYQPGASAALHEWDSGLRFLGSPGKSVGEM